MPLFLARTDEERFFKKDRRKTHLQSLRIETVHREVEPDGENKNPRETTGEARVSFLSFLSVSLFLSAYSLFLFLFVSFFLSVFISVLLLLLCLALFVRVWQTSCFWRRVPSRAKAWRMSSSRSLASS